LLRFQEKSGLAANANIDAGTALALEKIEASSQEPSDQQQDDQDDDGRFSPSIADNLKYGNIKTLSGYSDVLCERVDRRQFYQVRLAGGTLVSAAVAAAQFLASKDQSPGSAGDKVFEALTNVSKTQAVPELLLRASSAGGPR